MFSCSAADFLLFTVLLLVVVGTSYLVLVLVWGLCLVFDIWWIALIVVRCLRGCGR